MEGQWPLPCPCLPHQRMPRLVVLLLGPPLQEEAPQPLRFHPSPETPLFTRIHPVLPNAVSVSICPPHHPLHLQSSLRPQAHRQRCSPVKHLPRSPPATTTIILRSVGSTIIAAASLHLLPPPLDPQSFSQRRTPPPRPWRVVVLAAVVIPAFTTTAPPAVFLLIIRLPRLPSGPLLCMGTNSTSPRRRLLRLRHPCHMGPSTLTPTDAPTLSSYNRQCKAELVAWVEFASSRR